MDLTKLNHSVQSQIRSDMIIFNICRCVTELVENAIDAGATCIAVKMDLTKFQIQVVDNGCGVSKKHLDSIGTRYWSSKCSESSNTKKYSKPHDHRGEFLASIKNCCTRLMIVSRASEDKVTYCKIFDGSKPGTVVEALHQRVSKGTTIIINNFFGNLPVRQKRIVPAVEIQNMKRCIQGISLMYPSILFILKDDAKNVEILRIPRSSSTLKTFRLLFPQVVDHHSSMIKVVFDDENISMRAMICREAHNNRDLQFVFVNKRFLMKSEIRILLDELLSKKGFFEGVPKNTDDVSQPQPPQDRQKPATSKVQSKNAIFILNISCRPDEYRITFRPDKRQVDFKDKTKFRDCLTKLVDSFWKRGLFQNNSVPQNTAVAPPEKTKSTFMPRLLFEKMNKIRTIRGAAARRKVTAAEVGLNDKETCNSDLSRPGLTGKVTCHGAFEGHSGTIATKSLALEMTHPNSASSLPILEPFERLNSRPAPLKKLVQGDWYAENGKPVDSGGEPTLQPAPTPTMCTPSCIPPRGKPIISTIGLLNRQNLRREIIIVPEESISSILNTSKLHEKLQSVSREAERIEGAGCYSKSLFTLKGTYSQDGISSCCIPTNSNIHLYDVKKKFHLRKEKARRACKLEGLRIIKSKEKKHQEEINFPRRKKLEHPPKKMAVLKKSILQIDNSLYDPKIQSPYFSLSSKLTSLAYSQKGTFNWWGQSKEYTDSSAQVALLNPRTSKPGLTFDSRSKDGVLIKNQEPDRTESIQELNCRTVSKTNQIYVGKPIPGVTDFIYAPNLTSKNSEISKNTLPTFHSEFQISQGISFEFAKRDISRNLLWSTSNVVPYDEHCANALPFGKSWYSERRLNICPALKQDKSIAVKSCKVPQCICSCHEVANMTDSSTCATTAVNSDTQKKSATVNNSVAPGIRVSPSLFSRSPTQGRTSVEYFSNYSPYTIPISTDGYAVCGWNAANTHSLGIFSELAELYSVSKKAETSPCLGTLNSRPPAESTVRVPNAAEVIPIFSESCSEKLPNEVAHDGRSFLTQSLDRCSVLSNSVEVPANDVGMFCRNTGEDFKLTFTPRRNSSEYGEENANVPRGPNDPSQLAENSFGMEEDNFSVGITPAPYDPASLQLADNTFSVNVEDSSNDTTQPYTLSPVAKDSFCMNFENSWIGQTPGARFCTQFCGDSFSPELGKSEFSTANQVEAHNASQSGDDLESSSDQNTGANDRTQSGENAINTDLTSCPIADPVLCASTEVSNQLQMNDRICHEKDSLMEKILCRKNSKFLGAASVFDIPKGILDVQGTKSKPVSFEKSQKIDFNKFTKPCSMKNHLTFDDYGNSCLRIFPLMKEIIDSKEDDFKFEYGNFPEDLNCTIIFSKMDLKSVKFLAQLENKFLLSSLIKNDSREQIIVMFDQHAVDERIRVERLCKEYINERGVWRSILVNDTICIRVSRCEMSVILDFREDFCSRGIDFDFTEVNENCEDQFSIPVIRVPLCLHNRASREPTKANVVTCLKQLTESLIKELTHTLIRTRGISRNTTPQILQNIINSEACRGAVKFGEQLSSDICSTLLQSLWSCNIPFQCAHGRPLLAPLANVAKLTHIGKQKLPKRTFEELKSLLL